MDKSEGKDLFAKTLNRVTEETAKVYKISRIKFEIATLGRSKSEKMSKISRKLMELIKQGEVDAKLFEPEYSSILGIEAKMEELDSEADEIKDNLNIGFGKKKEEDTEPEDITPEPKAEQTDKPEESEKK